MLIWQNCFLSVHCLLIPLRCQLFHAFSIYEQLKPFWGFFYVFWNNCWIRATTAFNIIGVCMVASKICRFVLLKNHMDLSIVAPSICHPAKLLSDDLNIQQQHVVYTLKILLQSRWYYCIEKTDISIMYRYYMQSDMSLLWSISCWEGRLR